ncbi:MAG: hypothetical protein AB8F78_15090 [Saprospiraceae bacterium]
MKTSLLCGFFLLIFSTFSLAQSTMDSLMRLEDQAKVRWVVDTAGGYVDVNIEIHNVGPGPINFSYKIGVSKKGITGNASRSSQGGSKMIGSGNTVTCRAVKLNVLAGDKLNLSYEVEGEGFKDQLVDEKLVGL